MIIIQIVFLFCILLIWNLFLFLFCSVKSIRGMLIWLAYFLFGNMLNFLVCLVCFFFFFSFLFVFNQLFFCVIFKNHKLVLDIDNSYLIRNLKENIISLKVSRFFLWNKQMLREKISDSVGLLELFTSTPFLTKKKVYAYACSCLFLFLDIGQIFCVYVKILSICCIIKNPCSTQILNYMIWS